MTRPDLDKLEDHFAAARADPPVAPQGLLDQIEADGRARQPRSLPPRWRTLLKGIGGPAGLGGLVTATCAGIWIGATGPAPLAEPVESFLGVSMMDETDAFSGAFPGASDFGWDSDEEGVTG